MSLNLHTEVEDAEKEPGYQHDLHHGLMNSDEETRMSQGGRTPSPSCVAEVMGWFYRRASTAL